MRAPARLLVALALRCCRRSLTRRRPSLEDERSRRAAAADLETMVRIVGSGLAKAERFDEEARSCSAVSRTDWTGP
jgi:hypothetical protein